MTRRIGNRRTDEELELYKENARETRFRLIDQPNFNGSDELLKTMQNYERLYREGRPAITDEEWDLLVKKTGYVESLDQVLAPSGRRWRQMISPLVSLKKINTVDGIKSMFTGETMIVAPKLDGLTFNAIYEMIDERLVLNDIGTRGDGINSLIVHDGALDYVNLNWLPEIIEGKSLDVLVENRCIVNGRFELRGEVVIDKYEYSRDNDIDVNSIVPRTIASGMINRKMSYSVDNILNIVAYDLELGNKSKEFISHRYDTLWNRVSTESKKLLSKFNIVNRSTKIDSLVAYRDCNGEIKALVRDKENKEVREFSLEDKGKSRIESLYFISFSVSSEIGNIDRPDIISEIDGAMYIGDIPDFKDVFSITDSFDEAMKCIDNIYGTEMGVRKPNLERFRSVSRFALDGAVLKPLNSNKETQMTEPVERNGKIVVPTKPKDQAAVKFETDPSITRILKINKKTTKLGNVTVSADVEPTVVEGGAVVRSVNLHNEEWLSLPENQWIQEGVECELRLSMDIIPIISPISKQ